MKEETFTSDEVRHSLRSFLDWGEKEFGKAQKGYFSGGGFAARAVRWHLKQLENAANCPPSASPVLPSEDISSTYRDEQWRRYVAGLWMDGQG